MIDVPGQQLVDVNLGGGVVLEGSVCGDDGVCKVGGVKIEVIRECNNTTGECVCEFEFEFEFEVEVEIEVPDIVTDEGENFAIPVFPGDYQVRVFPDPASFQLPEISEVTVPRDTPLEVKLRRGAIMTGEVIGAEGPVGEKINECIKAPGEFECEFEIEIEGEPGDLSPCGVTEVAARNSLLGAFGDTDIAGRSSLLGVFGDTDIAGRYSLLAPTGTHTVMLEAKAGSLLDVPLKPVPDVVNITLPGPNIVDILVEAETEGLIVIKGNVFEPDGITPAAGVEIFARFEHKTSGATLSGRAYSDVNGNYLLVIKEP
jgi:hypothetical protein